MQTALQTSFTSSATRIRYLRLMLKDQLKRYSAPKVLPKVTKATKRPRFNYSNITSLRLCSSFTCACLSHFQPWRGKTWRVWMPRNYFSYKTSSTNGSSLSSQWCSALCVHYSMAGSATINTLSFNKIGSCMQVCLWSKVSQSRWALCSSSYLMWNSISYGHHLPYYLLSSAHSYFSSETGSAMIFSSIRRINQLQ